VWPIDHIGIAVSDLDAAIKWYTQNTGAVVGVRERLESQGVELVFLHTGEGACVELLAPLRPDATLAKFITQRGPGLHHLCYRVTNIEHELRQLSARGLRLIDTTPRPGAHNSKIAFIHPSACLGTLVELCERCS
jgi:methylmalonyl-CoA epimerase